MTTCIVHQCAVEAGKIQGKTMLLWVISLAIAKGVTKFLPYTTLCLVIRASTGCFTTCGHYCRRFFFLGLCDQKSSYKHVSDFGRLRSYGHFLIPVHAFVWTASHGTSGRVMYTTWWLIFCVASIIFATWLAQFTTERQPLLRAAVAFSKTNFKHRAIQIKGNFTKLTLQLYFICITYYAGLLFCSVYCQ